MYKCGYMRNVHKIDQTGQPIQERPIERERERELEFTTAMATGALFKSSITKSHICREKGRGDEC